MAQRKEVFLSGKTKFTHLLGRGDAQYQNWGVVLYLTPESHQQFLDLKKGSENVDGILNEIKQDEDGYYVSLRRPWTRNYKGVETAFTPPIVLGPDNQMWPSDKAIGNGSDVTVKCEYYTFKPPFKQKRGSAIRLVSARIDDYVPYNPEKDLREDEKKEVAGLLPTEAKPFRRF